MPSNIDILIEMGFPKNRAEKALAKTNYKGVQEAMEWLFNHAEDADIDEPFEAPKGNLLSEETATGASDGGETSTGSEAAAKSEPEQAQSLKCEECGKLLRTADDVQVHAAKTGHSNFSESTEEVKPLTAEEKERQMALLQEKMKRKRAEREEKEKVEAKEKEKLRRAQGKDLTMAKFEMEQKEMKQLAEQKRREKAEERAAKQKALDDIRRDKEARAAARAAAKGEAAPSAPVPAATAPTTPAVKRDYTECRLQIRLPDGKPLTQTFNANEQLAAVRLYVVTANPATLPDNFTFMTTFPRRVFSDEDMESPLSSLGLVPSAVIMVTKK